MSGLSRLLACVVRSYSLTNNVMCASGARLQNEPRLGTWSILIPTRTLRCDIAILLLNTYIDNFLALPGLVACQMPVVGAPYCTPKTEYSISFRYTPTLSHHPTPHLAMDGIDRRMDAAITKKENIRSPYGTRGFRPLGLHSARLGLTLIPARDIIPVSRLFLSSRQKNT